MLPCDWRDLVVSMDGDQRANLFFSRGIPLIGTDFSLVVVYFWCVKARDQRDIPQGIRNCLLPVDSLGIRSSFSSQLK